MGQRKVANTPSPRNKEVLHRLLKQYFRLAVLVVRWLKVVYFKAGCSVISLMAEVEDGGPESSLGQEGTPLFDPRRFRAQREQFLTPEARRILDLHPSLRTARDLDYLHVAFRSLLTYSRYPGAVQRAVCRAAWSTRFGPERIVVRQGHRPYDFYLVLAGILQVIVKDEEGRDQLVCRLTRGQAFGEIALATRNRRTASVVTASKVELLGLTKDDFEAIFLSLGDGIAAFQGTTNGANVAEYTRQLSQFRNWPVDTLSSNPAHCLSQYFPRGQLLVSGARSSEWIYIVRTGSLSVYQRLMAQTSPDEAPETKTKCFKRSFRNKLFLNPRQRKPSPEPPVFKNVLHMMTELERQIPGVLNSEDRMALLDYEAITERHMPLVRPGPQEHPAMNFKGPFLVSRRTNTERGPSALPIFIKVCTVERGQIFGLTHLLFGPESQPDLSLVSNGAECFLISKRFFLHGASDFCLGQLRCSVTPYPSELSMQNRLQQQQEWEKGRRRVLRETLERMGAARSQRKNLRASR